MENNEYRLVIDINGNVDDSKEKEDFESKQMKALTKLVKYQIAKPFINSTKQMLLNNVDTYYGSGELSQRIQMGLDTAHSLYQGGIMGVGLAGALGLSFTGGVVLGVGLTVLQKMFDLMVKQNEINNQAKLENQQLQILRGRAGIQFNRSRTGE